MSARGSAVIHITAGDKTALRAAVDDRISGYNDDPDTPETIWLDDVNWLDTAALIAADPAARSYAACDSGCEESNILHMYADGEHAISRHLDTELVIPADAIGEPWTREAITKWNRVRATTDPAIAEALSILDRAGCVTAIYTPADLRGLDPQTITAEMLAVGIERINLLADSCDTVDGANR